MGVSLRPKRYTAAVSEFIFSRPHEDVLKMTMPRIYKHDPPCKTYEKHTPEAMEAALIDIRFGMSFEIQVDNTEYTTQLCIGDLKTLI
nr:unnamed protein product [Callosobruchus analis]